MKLNNKICLVVGASSGMGRATAIEAGKQGATVIVAARRRDECESVVEQISRLGSHARSLVFDATDEAAVDHAFNTIEETHGRLDCAFNNLGATLGTSLVHETPSDRWHDSLTTNLTSVFYLMKREIPLMQKAGGGAIVNNSSTAGVQGVASMADYSAAKWGIIGLTRTAALEYGEQNIRTNAIAPGIIQTEKMQTIQADLPDLFEELRKGIPAGRFGEMQDIANLVTWLMSDEANYVNGTTLPIDGGRTAG